MASDVGGPSPHCGIRMTGSTSGGAGVGRRLLFQAVPETKTVKNRVHLDLLVGPQEHDAEVERLVRLGATGGGVHDGQEGRWTLLVDPEGNEFDVS